LKSDLYKGSLFRMLWGLHRKYWQFWDGGIGCSSADARLL